MSPGGSQGLPRDPELELAPSRTPTPLSGLTEAEVAERVERGLTNGTAQHTSRPLGHIIRSNVVTPFNGLLGALAVVVLATGAWQDALFGLLVVGNSAVGVVQEVRTKRTLDRLSLLTAARVNVIRDGLATEVAMEDVVIDDLVVLRSGDQVTADGLVVASDGLEIDESLLTGESDPVVKKPDDRVLSGSIVVAGSGRCQVTGVGADSYASRLTAEARRYTTTDSELVGGINGVLKWVTVAIVVTGPILFVSQSNSTSSWQAAVRGTVAGLVGMVPEGLVLLTSITFFAAALLLARRRVLVQQLPSVEGLARVDMLCLDKTGTLTDGNIAFHRLELLDPGDAEVSAALGALAADDNANATLAALHAAFPVPDWARVAAVPFSSSRKWSAAAFEGHGTWVLGAPEIVWTPAAADDPVARRADALASDGNRTVLVAHTSSALEGEHLPDGLRPA
ncbi:MAG TPA: HAD-IC family P-type ATPase, partial [Acidimicrobiales bacterium]|nr:HAD-IC family P-type ATPase [Acidimicrobiales bacterium]